jgi:hypothetical protein
MKKILTLIVALADVILLVVIISSFGQAKAREKEQTTTVKETYTSSEETGSASDYRDYLLHDDSGQESSYDQGIQDMEEASAEDIAAGSESEVSMADFDWYQEVVANGGFPSEAASFDDYEKLKGNWKAYIHYDPKNTTGDEAEMLLYVDISGTADEVDLTCSWRLIHYLKEDEFLSDDGDPSHFYGMYDGGKLHAEGPGKIDLKYFYEWGSGQYVIGMMETTNGVQAIICLTRP